MPSNDSSDIRAERSDEGEQAPVGPFEAHWRAVQSGDAAAALQTLPAMMLVVLALSKRETAPEGAVD